VTGGEKDYRQHFERILSRTDHEGERKELSGARNTSICTGLYPARIKRRGGGGGGGGLGGGGGGEDWKDVFKARRTNVALGNKTRKYLGRNGEGIAREERS